MSLHSSVPFVETTRSLLTLKNLFENNSSKKISQVTPVLKLTFPGRDAQRTEAGLWRCHWEVASTDNVCAAPGLGHWADASMSDLIASSQTPSEGDLLVFMPIYRDGDTETWRG